MNILQAKNEIKNAMKLYLEKDEYGRYIIPIEAQRPVFLMGPPGIGKTAVMEQIAHELNIGILSYSMTHHTRQSALGLPFISHKKYGEEEFDVSEYTMSEIIAAVYDKIEQTGLHEGILFLDEINCVSETLVPAMLQFLQYKTFGRHKIPEGWIVVTAGNPPEFNRSAREFDIVTWDRIRRVDVEADYSVWREYAVNSGIHPAVVTYLDSKKSDFYIIESTIDGKKFVTARGWFDLSRIMKLYEKNNITVTEQLICQYLQHDRISLDFSSYYDLFSKYQTDYQAETILSGNYPTELSERAEKAGFDERSSLIGILLGLIFDNASDVYIFEKSLLYTVSLLREIKSKISEENCDTLSLLNDLIEDVNSKIAIGKANDSISKEDHEIMFRTAVFINDIKKGIANDNENSFAKIKAAYDIQAESFNKAACELMNKIANAITFAENCFGEGQELLMIITELSINKKTAHLIDRIGCEKYFSHSKKLMISERMN